MTELVLLKLGGSLITDKTLPYTPRREVLDSLSAQIAEVVHSRPNLRLVLGHGSGSFGHTAAKEYGTRNGDPKARGNGEWGEKYWHGFAEVWYQASTLNRYVIDSLHKAGVDAITFSPAAGVRSANGKVAVWDISPIQYALANNIIPVVHGDVVFDEILGGTILSTEDLFEHLARQFRPQRILLAGLEEAVWADFPARKRRVEKISPASFSEVIAGVGASHGADVTGGMESKVRQMLDLVQEVPGLTAQIFSGEEAGNLKKVLLGEVTGTLIGL